MRALTVLVLLLSAIVVGCGGGGGSSGPDLNGWWEMGIHEEGSPDPYSFVFLGPASHAGSRVTYAGLDMSFDGARLTAADPDYADSWRSEYHLDYLSSNLFEGQLHAFRPGSPVVYRDLRMRRVAAPSGTLTAEGTGGGRPLDFSSSRAYAIVEQVASAGDLQTYEIRILDAHPASGNTLWLEVSLLRFLMFPHESDVPGDCTFALGLDEVAYRATNGAVVFTHFAAGERIRGTYQVIFGLDGTAQGSFDVPVVELR